MIITPDNIYDAHAKCAHDIFAKDYYVHIANDLIEHYGEPENAVDIITFWQRFWESLPDNKAIQRDPFYLICDIAENYMNPEFWEEEYK